MDERYTTVAAIDIGTSKVACAIAHIGGNDGSITVIGKGTAVNTGMRKGVVTDMAGYLNSFGVAGTINVASIVGAFAFVVFVVASFAQLVVGCLLDRFGPRSVFIGAAAVQVVFFGLMAGLRGVWALAVALGFMLGAFGQIPITDYMIAKLASGPARARVYGVRYVVSFSALAASLPLIAFVYEQWGFDTLFRLLSAAALIILLAVLCLPRRLPATN